MLTKKIYKIILSVLFIVFPSACALAQEMPKPLGDATPQSIIGSVISVVLGLVGSFALVMFVYGGILWMTAGGNAERVQKGKTVIIWSLLGLVVIFSAYAAVKFVFTGLGV